MRTVEEITLTDFHWTFDSDPARYQLFNELIKPIAEAYAAQFKLSEDEQCTIVSERFKSNLIKNEAEQQFLEMFNRIKKSWHEKRNMRFVATRTISKPAQLHTALKTYSQDELGKVIYNAFADQFHIDSKWRWTTTEFCTRLTTIEKYL